MDILIKGEKYLSKAIEFFMTVAFILTAILVFINAALRYTTGASILWGPDLAIILFIYCTSIGSALMIVHKQHIRISYFAELLPKSIQKPLEILVYLMIISVNIAFIYYSIGWIQDTGSYIFRFAFFPSYVPQSAVPIGCGLVVLYSIYTILLILFRPEKYYSEIEDEASIS